MRTFDFKNRLFLAYAVVTAGIVLLFGFLLITITSAQNRETELLHQQEVFAGNLLQMETMISQATRLANQVATSNEVLSLLIALDEADSGQGGGSNYFADQLMDTIRIGSLLAGFNGVDGFADRISVFNRYGDYVSTGRLYETPERVSQRLADTPWIDGLVSQLQSQPESFWLSGFHGDLWSDNPNTQFLSLYHKLSYTEQSKPYGLVAVQLQADRFKTMEFWQDADHSEYFLLDAGAGNGPVCVYPTGRSFPVEPVYALIDRALGEAPAEGRPTLCLNFAQEDTAYQLLAARVSVSNWFLVRLLPVNELLLPYQNNYVIMVLGCLAMMILFLLIVRYMAERISLPLRQLSASIGGINLQNMRLDTVKTAQAYSTRELIALDDAFRAMLARLDNSIGLEMQAYLRVLQSQMNPHFLYNMLSIIIASSESAGDARTVSMCQKLSAMLRYIADFSRELVPLRDEVEHTRNYLKLMKERYENLFSFEIDLDEDAGSILLPKLAVQPLAENCFVHGFKNEPPWQVRITGSISAGKWRLRVEDNGVGMTQAEIQSLLERMEEYRSNVAGKYQELTLGGMGLINTLLRLSLLPGGPVTYAIANRPEGGLRVEIGGTVDDTRIDR